MFKQIVIAVLVGVCAVSSVAAATVSKTGTIKSIATGNSQSDWNTNVIVKMSDGTYIYLPMDASNPLAKEKFSMLISAISTNATVTIVYFDTSKNLALAYQPFKLEFMYLGGN